MSPRDLPSIIAVAYLSWSSSDNQMERGKIFDQKGLICDYIERLISFFVRLL